jgi:hypothetical protein
MADALEICANCKFFIPAPADQPHGVCMRYPPFRPFKGRIRPLVLPTDWCGEFQVENG